MDNSTPNISSAERVWFITGTSQGFGRDIARAALDDGGAVVATSRRPDKAVCEIGGPAERLLVVPLDLTDPQQISAAVDAAIRRFGRIDVLVNNAGHGILGAVEEASDADVLAVYQINVFGLLRVTRAVLPHMRRRRSGHIVNLSSIGGLTGSPGWGIYNSTKFAVEGLSEALAAELVPLGIRVTIVEPGAFRTNFLGDSLSVATGTLPDYDATVGSTRAYRRDMNGAQDGDPVRGANAIVDAVKSLNPPLHLLLGADAYQRATKKLADLKAQFETWRDVTLATTFSK
jgi:NAD(P)-dependent dehydrogenase (short-subunit alcohol dehydrogenase family)